MSVSEEKKVELYNRLKQRAEEKGFELLEPNWLGYEKKHLFYHTESGIEYEWTAINIFNNGFPKDLRSDLDHFNNLKQLAKENGYKLLESKWLGVMKKHRFLHIESGKEYQCTPDNLKYQGFPLTEGQRYLTEEVCRQAFVHIFGGEFQTNRERLKPRHGKSLQLDGYQEFGEPIPGILAPFVKADKAEVAFNLQNLQIAFEYQGHDGHRTSKRTMELDRLRVEYCKQEGILLVVIDPPASHKIRDSEYMYAHVTDAIKVALGQPNLEFPPGFTINLSNWNADKKAHAELNYLAEENGFKLLEPKWLGAGEKHRFVHIESREEYQWRPNQLKQAGFPKLDYEKLKELADQATKSGFKLLEPKWLGTDTKHRFLHIESGKEYQGTPKNLKKHGGFPKRFTHSQTPIPKQYALETSVDQITSQLNALNSDATLSTTEKQAAMDAYAAELSALMPPCPYEDDEPASSQSSEPVKPVEPAPNDEEVEIVRQRMRE